MKADTDNNAHFNHYYEWKDIIRKRGLVKSKFKGKVIRLGDTLIQHIVNKGKSDKDEGDWRQIIVNFAIATWEDPQEVWQGYKGNHVFVR